METREIAMIKTAIKPYKKVADPGDKVLLIADTSTDQTVWQVFAMAAQVVGATPIIALMLPDRRDYEDPPEAIQRAADACDVLHYLTRKGLVHSRWGRRMCQAGKRRIHSEGITADQLLEGAALCDEPEYRAWINKIIPFWDEGKIVHFTTPAGTDFTVSVEGHRSLFTSGAELLKVRRAQFPGGECPCTPKEGTGDGVIVVDQSIHHPAGTLRHPITLRLEKGEIVDISGDWEAAEYKKWVEEYGDEHGKTLAELSVGCNPMAKFTGSPRQDRFVLGSCHVGFGMNADVGGTIDSNIHYDAILSKPTITVDGTTVVKDGVIVV